MTEPATDHVRFDTCSQQVHGGRVAEHVRSYAPTAFVERRSVASHQLVDAEASQGRSALGAEDRCIRVERIRTQ